MGSGAKGGIIKTRESLSLFLQHKKYQEGSFLVGEGGWQNVGMPTPRNPLLIVSLILSCADAAGRLNKAWLICVGRDQLCFVISESEPSNKSGYLNRSRTKRNDQTKIGHGRLTSDWYEFFCFYSQNILCFSVHCNL